jgi:hypothetical protein
MIAVNKQQKTNPCVTGSITTGIGKNQNDYWEESK